MKKDITKQQHLLSKRAKIVKFLKGEGYSGADIAAIFNVDESQISKILSAEAKYKGLVKSVLKD